MDFGAPRDPTPLQRWFSGSTMWPNNYIVQPSWIRDHIRSLVAGVNAHADFIIDVCANHALLRTAAVELRQNAAQASFWLGIQARRMSQRAYDLMIEETGEAAASHGHASHGEETGEAAASPVSSVAVVVQEVSSQTDICMADMERVQRLLELDRILNRCA